MIRRTGRQRTGALLAATLLAGAVLLVGGVIGVAGPARAAAADDILSMVNAARAENGVGPVRLNGAMSSVATAWSQRMADAGAMSHNPDYSAQIPGGWSRAAENVAFNSPADAAGLQTAWMGSPGHRANILDPAFTDIGIGVVVQGGSAWGTQVFGAYGAPLPLEQPPAPDPAPEPAVAAPATVVPAPVLVATTPTPSPQPIASAPTPSASPAEAAVAPTASLRGRPGDVRPAADGAPDANQSVGTGLSTAAWLVPLVGILVLSGAGFAAFVRLRRSTATSGGVGGTSGGAGSGHGEP